MRRYIARKIGYPIKDFYSGAQSIKTKYFLDGSQFWDNERLSAYRLKKLRALVDHAYYSVPYYTELFDHSGIHPEDIKTLEDIKKIPILSKEDALKNEDKMLDIYWKKKIYYETKTGGTTGPPLKVLKDRNAYSFEWGSYYRWLNWINLKLGDPIVTFWGSPKVLSANIRFKLLKHVTNILTNQMYINSFNLNENTIPHIIDRLNDFKPKLLKGYLSALLQLAKFITKNKVEFNFKPTGIMTTSETLYPNQKNFLQEVFGCPVYDQYGCTEVGSVAFECNKHKGLHINQEHVIVEVVSANKNSSTGKIVLTDLDCHIMPFIRYENGDLATLSGESCTCGINHPLIKKIDGRIAQTIYLKDGSEVHGVFFTDLLFEIPGSGKEIIKFQVYQTKVGEIEFRYESYEKLSSDYIERLNLNFLRFFNHVKITRYSEIPARPSGKHLYILNEIKS